MLGFRSLISNLCITLGLAGLGITVLGDRLPVQLNAGPMMTSTSSGPAPSARSVPQMVNRANDPDNLMEEVNNRPITWVRAPAAFLDAPVARAPFAPTHDGGTWSVPDDRAGHAENTAGAGEPGNVVLFGHVSWRGVTGVFKNLHRLTVGDHVEILSVDRLYRYRVASVGSTRPEDPEPLATTAVPALTLVTCDGLWLPQIWDYSSRLVVRAEIASPGETGIDEAAIVHSVVHSMESWR